MDKHEAFTALIDASDELTWNGYTALAVRVRAVIPDAAAECGMSVDELVDRMAEDGLLIEHPNGGYIASPHPDLRELDR